MFKHSKVIIMSQIAASSGNLLRSEETTHAASEEYMQQLFLDHGRQMSMFREGNEETDDGSWETGLKRYDLHR